MIVERPEAIYKWFVILIWFTHWTDIYFPNEIRWNVRFTNIPWLCTQYTVFRCFIMQKKNLFVCIRRIHIHFIHYYCHFITNKRKTKDLYAVEHEAWKKTYVAITLLSFEGKYQKKFLLRFEYALNNCIDWTLGNVCPRLFSVFLVEWYVT